MLIKESQSVKKSSILDQLNEAVYLTEEESSIHPAEISVFEMSRLGEGSAVVSYTDIERLAESNNISFIDSLNTIAETNNIEESKLTVAVDEADLIADPSIVQEMNYVVVPISEKDPVYQICSEAVDKFIESGDESFLEALVNESKIGTAGKVIAGLGLLSTGAGAAGGVKTLKDIGKGIDNGNGVRQSVVDNAGKGVASIGLGLGGMAAMHIGGSLYVGDKIYDHYKNKPKNVIAKAIAALRNKYHRIMTKAASASDKTLAGKLKNAGGKILEIIDKLLAKMQEGANKFSEK
jgi:hypothetical protein